MDEALGQLIIGILVVVLVIYLIGLAMMALFLGLAIALAGGVSLGIYRLATESAIERYAYEALAVRGDGWDVRLDVDPDVIASRGRELSGWARLLAVGSTAIAALLIAPNIVREASIENSRELSLLVAVVGAGVGLVASYQLAAWWSFATPIAKVASNHVESVGGIFKAAVERLADAEGRVARIARDIPLEAPPSRRQELYSIFNEAGNRLIREPETVQGSVAEVMDKVEADEASLKRIAQEMAAVRKLHRQATDEVVSVGFRSLFTPLDEIQAFFDSPHLSGLVRAGNYGEIRSQLAGVEQELRATIDKARAAGAGGGPRTGPAEGDPWAEDVQLTSGDQASIELAYRRLTARAGDTPTLVRRLYHGLVKAYHTDQGSDGDQRRFQQINDAYSFLKNEGLA